MLTKICCIGHITLDKIITPNHTVHIPGGTSYYFSHALSHLNPSSMLLVTKLGARQLQAAKDIKASGIEVKAYYSTNSVYFENSYDNQNHRTQRLLAKADPFEIEDFNDVDAETYHLGTLLSDDISTDVIKYLAGKGKVSVDAQGYLRKVEGEAVLPTDWAEKNEALKYITILKVNKHEMETLTGLTDPYRAAESLAAAGVKEVVITLGENGSLILSEGRFHEIPAYKPEVIVDATGCGDTYMAGYLYQRGRGADITEAGRFAAAMCTLKLQASGPFTSTTEDVEAIINRAL